MLIRLVIGLPGSGKTHYLSLLDDSWHKIDDIKSIEQFPLECDKLVITDPWFCLDNIKNSAVETLRIQYPNAEFEFVYFENNPVACLDNIKRRNDGRLVNGFVTQFSGVYNPPQDAIKVYTKP